jgi:hypothetical protein
MSRKSIITSPPCSRSVRSPRLTSRAPGSTTYQTKDFDQAWAGAERLAHGMCDALDASPRARWPLDQVEKPAGGEPAAAADA